MPEGLRTEVLVAGAGPAGMAAAAAAAGAGRSVIVVDDLPGPGGQIWRGGPGDATSRRAFAVFESSGARGLYGARVIGFAGPRAAAVETADAALQVEFRALVLATGAQERFLPFPGWTLPGVMGAGGLQALSKGGLEGRGFRVIVAGTGPLLLAVAGHLRGQGARVVRVVEQAPWGRLLGLARAALADPARRRGVLGTMAKAAGIRIQASAWIAEARGDDRLREVVVAGRRSTERIACDFLACGFHLVPSTGLAALAGCRCDAGRVVVDEWQETTAPGVFCAGEGTGVGGLEKARVEGEIAGLAAAGQREAARALLARRDAQRRFARALESATELRPELRDLARDDTIVCRCEDVSLGALRACRSGREAKLHHRCGMGPCQGRICGGATAHLFGWAPDSVRPPLYPARVSTLHALASMPGLADGSASGYATRASEERPPT